MNVLIIGGGGHVGSIVRQALDEAHQCAWFDVRPIDGVETIVGSVSNDDDLQAAVKDRDAVVYLAMAPFGGKDNDTIDISMGFEVNTTGWYRTLRWGLRAGVRRFVYASSLSVYDQPGVKQYIDESFPPDTWYTYGMTKRLSEYICGAAGEQHPDAMILALRLTLPSNEAQWPTGPSLRALLRPYTTGPKDVCRLFLAALACDKPGVHIVQTSGDVQNVQVPNTRATELLGWAPRGE